MSDWLENLKRYALSDEIDYRLTWEDAGIALEEIERLRGSIADTNVVIEQVSAENERLRADVASYKEMFLDEQKEADRLWSTLEEIKAVAGKGASFYTDRIYTIARKALLECE